MKSLVVIFLCSLFFSCSIDRQNKSIPVNPVWDSEWQSFVDTVNGFPEVTWGVLCIDSSGIEYLVHYSSHGSGNNLFEIREKVLRDLPGSQPDLKICRKKDKWVFDLF